MLPTNSTEDSHTLPFKTCPPHCGGFCHPGKSVFLNPSGKHRILTEVTPCVHKPPREMAYHTGRKETTTATNFFINITPPRRQALRFGGGFCHPKKFLFLFPPISFRISSSHAFPGSPGADLSGRDSGHLENERRVYFAYLNRLTDERRNLGFGLAVLMMRSGS